MDEWTATGLLEQEHVGQGVHGWGDHFYAASETGWKLWLIEKAEDVERVVEKHGLKRVKGITFMTGEKLKKERGCVETVELGVGGSS